MSNNRPSDKRIVDPNTGLLSLEWDAYFSRIDATLRVHPAPSFMARKNTIQTLAPATFTKVIFQVETFDTNDNFESSTFTPSVSGKYILTAQFAIDSGADAFILIFKNGSPYCWGNRIANASTANYPNICVVADANGVSDYFEVLAYIGVGGDILSDSDRTYFSGGMLY